jgi:glucose-6-phosphate-specific signal transduction histidine kinase
MDKWVTAINVLNSITSLITIPVLSALIAQAAAVYSQRHNSRQNLRLKHLIALADRGWTNPFILGTTWMWEGRDSKSIRRLLHFAAGLIIIGEF